MRSKKNYLEQAKKHEDAFRAIMFKHQVYDAELTVEEIYQKYSTGNRRGKWTILDFYHDSDDKYVFSLENVSIMSGNGNTSLWEFKNGETNLLKRMSAWMS